VLALSVVWQAFYSERASSLHHGAIALMFKAIVIPVALHRIVKQLAFIATSSRPRASVRPCWPNGLGRASMVLMLRVTAEADCWRARISPSPCRSCCSDFW
jgi:hydrogenase-4 component E